MSINEIHNEPNPIYMINPLTRAIKETPCCILIYMKFPIPLYLSRINNLTNTLQERKDLRGNLECHRSTTLRVSFIAGQLDPPHNKKMEHMVVL